MTSPSLDDSLGDGSNPVRWKIRMVGMVQGIGFRPFVYRIARRHGLTGFVLNDSRGAEIQVQGEQHILEKFWEDFWNQLPPLAQVAEWERVNEGLRQESDFCIQQSRAQSETRAFVTPDAHVCDQCLAEIFDPTQRRYRYPFTNCTNCGPRYTIIQAVPYDRPNTTMSEFPLCEACRREYEDPMDRRFHAQPIACPDCGPTLWLCDAEGVRIPSEDPLRVAARFLREGRIVAIKGLGGFHLAVDAANEDAVRELRRRKWREAKPFALMAADLDWARRLVRLDEDTEAVLVAPSRPIVLAPMLAEAPVVPSVAPGLSELGVMLPYTPLHYILMEDAPKVLVMTSGNLSGEPLISDNDQAIARLGNIADLFVLHDRLIHNPCDDSVVRRSSLGLTMVRRARGYVPAPLTPRAFRVDRAVLAVGPELKNTVCLTRPGQFVPSQHLGDLTNPRAIEAFEDAVGRLAGLLDVEPTLVACDMHPEYHSTHFARALATDRGLPLVPVQHHHAHMAACMVDNDLPLGSRVVGVIWDGTGYGLDATTWGGEFFVGGYHGFERAAHLAPLRLPGGDAATLHPWRLLVAALWDMGWQEFDGLSSVQRQDPAQVELLRRMLAQDLRCAPGCGAGRIWDAAAALLDFDPDATDKVRYEAQLAIELEALGAHRPPTADSDLLPFEFADGVLDLCPMLIALADLVSRQVPVEDLAARFIDSTAHACALTAERVARRSGCDTVVLSGGCFQNVRLTHLVTQKLTQAGLICLTHRSLPPNDGGLSVGQAAVALARMGA